MKKFEAAVLGRTSVNPAHQKPVPQEAGVLEAGDLKAGPPGLVAPTPDMRSAAINMMQERMANAHRLYDDSLYCARQPGYRDVDMIILHQAQRNRLVLLWMAQTMHLVELCDEFQRRMTLDEEDAAMLRRAQSVTEERIARKTHGDTQR